MNNSRQSGPGCLWIFLILLLIGGPRLIGEVVAVVFILLFVLILLVGIGAFILFRKLGLKDYLKKQTEDHNLFVKYTVKLMIKIAEADGEIDKEEILTIKTFFREHMRYGRTQMFWIDQLIEESIGKDEDIETLCSQFNTHFSLTEKRLLIQLLYQVALADGILEETEKELIEKIATLLEFPDSEHQNIKNIFFTNRAENPFNVLGVSESSPPNDIKKAYRDLCKENHPDKVTHLGEEFKNVAEEKMTKINQAYEQVKKMGRV